MTESSKQRPQEFWIDITSAFCPILFDGTKSEKPIAHGSLSEHPSCIGVDPSDYVHVIEASYAKELEAKLAVAVKALERISGKELSCFNSNLNRCDYVAIQALAQLRDIK